MTHQPVPSAPEGFGSHGTTPAPCWSIPAWACSAAAGDSTGTRSPTRPLPPTSVVQGEGHVELFERLGLIVPGQRPHSILRLPDFELRITLPPRRVH